MPNNYFIGIFEYFNQLLFKIWYYTELEMKTNNLNIQVIII